MGHDHLESPTHCFCQIPREELKKWAEKRYRQSKSTMELLAEADNPHDKEVISIVALLDVDEESMLKMMGNVDLPEHHIIHCRENVLAMLDDD